MQSYFCLGFPGSSAGKKLQGWRPWFDSWVRTFPWRRDSLPTPVFMCFPDDSDVKESTCNTEDLNSISGLGRYPGGGHDKPLQHSCLENPDGLQAMGSGRVGHDRVTKHSTTLFGSPNQTSAFVHAHCLPSPLPCAAMKIIAIKIRSTAISICLDSIGDFSVFLFTTFVRTVKIVLLSFQITYIMYNFTSNFSCLTARRPFRIHGINFINEHASQYFQMYKYVLCEE